MKYHRHLVETLATALADTVDYPADKVIEKQFKRHRKWGSRDRRFFAEAVYEVTRWRRLLEYISDSQEPIDWWLAYLHLNDLPLPEFGRTLEKSKVMQKYEEAQSQRAIRQSIPDWLDEWGARSVSNWPEILEELNQPAPVFLRPNQLKTDAEQLIEALSAEEIDAEVVQGAARLAKRANVFRTKAFQRGLFEVQDLNSQKIAPLLEVEPGQRVIDACAGAGGKTLHLAALMQNKGKIIALDIHQWKLKELRQRSSRAGADIIDTRQIQNTKVIKRLHESADRLLLDVPCSGFGVIRRNPDSKWRMNQERCKELQGLQSQILEDYSRMLKPGGKMVYSTCSIFPEENQNQVDLFLSRHPEFQLEVAETVMPETGGGDGFFMCRLGHQG